MEDSMLCLVGSCKPLVLSVLASLLERIVARNERKVLLLMSESEDSSLAQNCCCMMTKFCSKEIPVMSIEKYLDRIHRYTQCSPSAFVVAYVYIDRLLLSNPSFLLTGLNIHRLLITSVMVATKFLDDLHYRNDYYAKVGGLSKEEMNSLELEFLFMLKFKLQVTVSVFQSYCSHLQREISLGGGFQIEQTLLRLSAKSSKLNLLHQQDKENSNSNSNNTSPPVASIKKKQRLLRATTYAGC